MKAFNKTLCLLAAILLLGAGPLRAQWDTLFHPSPSSPAYVHNIEDLFFVSTTGYAVGSYHDQNWGYAQGLIYKTTNGGATWSISELPAVVGGVRIHQIHTVHFTSPATGYIGVTCLDSITTTNIYAAVLKTTDGGITWNASLVLSGAFWGGVYDICFTSPSTGYALGCINQTGATSVYTTNNAGATWTTHSVPSTAGLVARSLFFDNTGNGSVAVGKTYSIGIQGELWHSTNSGNTWTNTYAVSGYDCRALTFSSGQIGYAVADTTDWFSNTIRKGKVLKTTDGGASWSTVAVLSNFGPRCLFFIDDTTGYIGGFTESGFGPGLLKTIDGGLTWIPQTHPSYNAGAPSWYGTREDIRAIHFSAPGTGYAVDDSTYSASSSISWMSGPGFYNISQSCSVYLGPDTTFCQQVGQLFATPGAPGNDYVYSWNPGTGLSDSTAQAPFVSYVHNQQYVVTMTDTVTNCTATDTIVVSAYNWALDTVYNCNNSPVTLDFGPGASNYFWQFYTDPQGNTSPLNANTQTITVNSPGSYAGYAVFPGCGALTSIFTIVDSCNCWNQFTYQQNASACGDTVLFSGSAGPSVTSWTWDMGDGNIFSGPGLSTVNHHYAMGTYTVTLTTMNIFNCTATSSLVITVAGGIAVDAGADTTFCQQQGQLNATPLVAGSNYVYAWSPANGLDNPFTQNPNVISGVSNQSYTVTITDTVTGCTAFDSVLISAYYFTSGDTLYICDTSYIMLDLGPGASNYYWQHFVDTAGNLSPMGNTTQQLYVNQPGQYLAFASFPGCGTLTNLFYVIDSCNVYVSDVWPGDCNYDLVANMADALHIGLGYGATDATRPNASPLWYAQPMNDWTQSFTNCNYKHADADGDGVINVNDTLPISLNYGNTHPFRLGAPEFIASAPTLELVANYDTCGLQTLVTIDVRLGSAALPVDSLYGISFRITADAGLIDTTLTVINLNTTWLGTMGGNAFGFRKAFPGGGRIDVAESRNDHVNRLNGSGTIATFSIVTTDNLSGIAVCHIDVTDVTAVTASQHYLPVNIINDSVVINSAAPAGISRPEPSAAFALYPNPANENVTVQTGATVSRIEICDMLGRTVHSVSPASATTVLNTSALADGVYLVRVYSGNAVSTQKLTVTR